MATVKLTILKPRIATLGSRLKPLQGKGWRTGKTGSTARGYGYAWQQARARHLQAHPLCVRCDAEGRVTAATVVDHRVPHEGDQKLFWDESNWDSLCTTHHSRDKQREEARGRGG